MNGAVCASHGWSQHTQTVVFFFVSLDRRAFIAVVVFCLFVCFLLNGSLWLFTCEIMSNTLRPHKL